jgi:hypothetical protein
MRRTLLVIATVSTLASMLVGAPGPANAASPYQVVPVLGITGQSLNDRGQVGGVIPGPDSDAVGVWDAGSVTPFVDLLTQPSVHISPDGSTLVGNFGVDIVVDDPPVHTLTYHAGMFTSGALRDLGELSTTANPSPPVFECLPSSGATAINASGTIVGGATVVPADCPTTHATTAATVFDPTLPSPTALPEPNLGTDASPLFATDYTALDLNDAGTVLGQASAPSTYEEVVTWTQQGSTYVPSVLPALASAPYATSTYEARVINGAGDILGVAHNLATRMDALVLWPSGGGVQPIPSTCPQIQGRLDMNDSRQIVANSCGYAALWSNGTWTQLGAYGMSTALAINNYGWILGIGMYAVGQSGFFLLEPADTIAPSVTCEPADGVWRAANASIACTAADSESGLANAGDASFSLSTSVGTDTEDANASTDSRSVCDNAGNCATAGPIGGNMIDRKAPAVSCGTADGLWHAADVSIACSAGDGGSGLASAADASFSLATSVATATDDLNAATGSRSACDAIGNCATAGPVNGNHVDKKDPSITVTLSPATGPYVVGSIVSATYSCADTGSGMTGGGASCPASGNLDTSAVGTFTPSVSATDAVGNTGSATFSYSVVAPAVLPGAPTGLQQYKSDGVTAVRIGATAKTPVVMKATVSDADGDLVRLQVEVKSTGTAFGGTGLLVSSAVTSGGTTSVIFGASATGAYHWRARTIDANGDVSAWVSFGGNAESAADFKIVGKI